MRSRLKNREVSERKQVGDIESMVNEDPSDNMNRSWKEVGWDEEEVV